MKIISANIGGLTGHNNIMKILKEQETSKLPDILVTQECGPEDNFKGLEPFFDSFVGSSHIRLHHNKTTNFKNLQINKTLHILSFTTSIPNFHKGKPPITVGFISGYRNHNTNIKKFLDEIDKTAKNLCKKVNDICITGDFNITTENQLLSDLIDKYNLINQTTTKHKHRLHTKSHQIDHVLVNSQNQCISTTTNGSLENISQTNHLLGHPSFTISLQSIKPIELPKTIKITNWENVIQILNTTNPDIPILTSQYEDKLELTAESIITWTNNAINSNIRNKSVIIKQIFNYKYLTQPEDNPNVLNMPAWKNYYRTIKNLKEGNCRIFSETITPTEFCATQQKKLTDMPNINKNKIKEHIDSICPNFTFNTDNLTSNFHEIKSIINNLNFSGAKDYNAQSSKDIKTCANHTTSSDG